MTDFFTMKWRLTDIESVLRKASDKIAPVAEAVAKELKIGKNEELFIVGGFVRDNVLAALSGRENISKDIDLILPTRPVLENNPNILKKRKTSLGGTKICTKNFPEIDIFQQNTTMVELIVRKYFDFNCNALYYSRYSRAVFVTSYFYDFLSHKVIDLLNFIDMGQKYPEHAVVSRALKFQVQFQEKYGLEVNLSRAVLDFLYNMDKETEQKMFDYTEAKVKSEITRNKMINEYKRLNNR